MLRFRIKPRIAPSPAAREDRLAWRRLPNSRDFGFLLLLLLLPSNVVVADGDAADASETSSDAFAVLVAMAGFVVDAFVNFHVSSDWGESRGDSKLIDGRSCVVAVGDNGDSGAATSFGWSRVLSCFRLVIHDDFFFRVKMVGAGPRVTVVVTDDDGLRSFSVVDEDVDEEDNDADKEKGDDDSEGGVGARRGEVKDKGSEREGDKGAAISIKVVSKTHGTKRGELVIFFLLFHHPLKILTFRSN